MKKFDLKLKEIFRYTEYNAFVYEKIFKPEKFNTMEEFFLSEEWLNLSILGIIGEFGEIADMVKKDIYHRNKKMVYDDLVKEVGDLLFYINMYYQTFDEQITDVCEVLQIEDIDFNKNLMEILSKSLKEIYAAFLIPYHSSNTHLQLLTKVALGLLDWYTPTTLKKDNIEDYLLMVIDANKEKLNKRHGLGKATFEFSGKTWLYVGEVSGIKFESIKPPNNTSEYDEKILDTIGE